MVLLDGLVRGLAALAIAVLTERGHVEVSYESLEQDPCRSSRGNVTVAPFSSHWVGAKFLALIGSRCTCFLLLVLLLRLVLLCLSRIFLCSRSERPAISRDRADGRKTQA